MADESKLTNADRNALIENNKKISELLSANERILEKAGYDLPKDNFAFDPVSEQKLRVQIPTGYIRSKDYYLKEYGLMKICGGDLDQASNIAYSLEISDFYNYILNRFGIYGPILVLTYKQATINAVSIIEALVKAHIETLRQRCIRCVNYRRCEARVTKNDIRSRFQNQMEIYKNLQLLDGLRAEDYDQICALYEYRNHVHLLKSKDNDLKEDRHSVEQYNRTIMGLRFIDRMMIRELEADTGDACRRFAAR